MWRSRSGGTTHANVQVNVTLTVSKHARRIYHQLSLAAVLQELYSARLPLSAVHAVNEEAASGSQAPVGRKPAEPVKGTTEAGRKAQIH
jgi:hypothetical protein